MVERLQLLNPQSLVLAPTRERGERGEQGGEWWFERHPLALVNETKLMGEWFDAETLGFVGSIGRLIYSSCAEAYSRMGCDTFLFNEDMLVYHGSKEGVCQPPSKANPLAMILNPVIYKVPGEAMRTLALIGREQPSFFSSRAARLKGALREQLPEVSVLKVLRRGLPRRDLPVIIRTGREVSRAMNLTEKHHHNFTNMVFIEDEGGDILNLPYLWLQHFGWSLMAKVGAFKNLIVPFSRVDGRFSYDLILNDLAGGHPVLSLEELPRRLMAFGSAREMSEWRALKDLEISRDFWLSLPEIRGLMALSRFCGERDLLSPPVALRDLVKARRLAKVIERVANYSRQAEGAFLAFAPVKSDRLVGLKKPFDGIYVATISGRFGAVKTALEWDDLAPVVTFFEGGVPGVAMIEGGKEAGPSIEAYEMIHSQFELIDELEKGGRECLLRLRRVDRGYVFDEGGDLRVVPWRLILHFHRNFKINNPERILRIEVDLGEDPPFPCGSDKTHEVTKKALRKAWERWETGERQAQGAVIRFKNHGCLFVGFWTEDESGIISENPATTFREAIERGYMETVFEVEQG